MRKTYKLTFGRRAEGALVRWVDTHEVIGEGNENGPDMWRCPDGHPGCKLIGWEDA